MAIIYPRAFPIHTGVRSVEIRAKSAVAYSQSPFTFAGQSHEYAGQMWSAGITLPPMRRVDAEVWVAWLLSMRGMAKTFLLGDPSCVIPRGLAYTFLGTPAISAQTGGTINVTGASANKTGWLLTGDYIQIGTGSGATLHKVLADADTDGSGNVTLEVWPYVRGTRTATISVDRAQGVFRLESNEMSWSVNEASIYGLSFDAVERV